MADGRDLLRRAIIATASTVLLVAGSILAVRSSATEKAGPDAGTAALPTEIQGRVATSASSTSASLSSSSTSSAPPPVPRLVPVAIDIPIASTHYPQGVHAEIIEHPLNADYTLFVPADPEVLSWASNDATINADRGTAIITGHVNYVINGRLVIGALADLSEYAKSAIGSIITVQTKDGPVLKYRIVAGREYSKDQLAASGALRSKLFDQTSIFGPPSHPSARLLLVSCGGAFDPATGEYEDNVFLYALPVS